MLHCASGNQLQLRVCISCSCHCLGASRAQADSNTEGTPRGYPSAFAQRHPIYSKPAISKPQHRRAHRKGEHLLPPQHDVTCPKS